MILTTDRLILRPIEERDRLPIGRIVADPEVRRFFVETLTAEENDAAMEKVLAAAANDGIAVQAAELRATGETIGIIGLARIPDETRAAILGHPEIGIDWQLSRDAWGQGLAPEGARAYLDYGFGKLGLSEIVAFTYAGNQPSRRVMEKLGMTYDPVADFEHPGVPEGHRLRPHVLYRITR